MTDEQPQGGPESGRESPTIKPGHLLREARERKRLSLQAVAEHLNLRAQVVEYLEQDRYERLPPLTFVKGYLRAYAKLVEEPEDRIMAAFAQLGLEAEAREPELPRGQPRGAGARWLPALLLLAVVVVAALFWLRGEQGLPWQDEGASGAQETSAAAGALNDEREPTRRALTGPAPTAAEGGVQRAEEQAAGDAAASDRPARDREQAAAPVQTAPEESVQAPAQSPRPEPEAAPAQAETETAPVEPATDSAPAQASAEIEPDAESQAQTQPESVAEPEPAADLLVIRVRGNAWMDVRDGGGERVLYGTVQGPELFRFDGPYPYRLTIGDASAVELEFRGEPVDLAPHTRGRVARLSLPEQR